jgi:type III restriction enzyme
VTPETARLLQHWRHHEFGGVRPFFCQVEAVETAIWFTEVAPHLRGTIGDGRADDPSSCSSPMRSLAALRG